MLMAERGVTGEDLDEGGDGSCNNSVSEDEDMFREGCD